MSAGICAKCGRKFNNLEVHWRFCGVIKAKPEPLPVEVIVHPYPDIMTQCPNCKMVYKATVPDGKPHFLSGKHPKEAL